MEQASDLAAAPKPSMCCAAPAPTQGKCLLCAGLICNNCVCIVNGKPTCAKCRDQIIRELEAEAKNPPIARGAAGGIAAALAAGAAWTAAVALTESEIGIVAVGVGYLAGLGVFLGSGKRRGEALQKVAVACAALGLLVGKYFTVVYLVKKHIPQAASASFFDPRFVPIVASILPRTVSLFDALWLFIAFQAAWKLLKPTALKVANGRNAPPAAAPAGS